MPQKDRVPQHQQKLQQSFDAYTIDPETSLPQAEKLLALESRFKLAHFRLLIAIKNALTEEQIDALNQEINQKLKERGTKRIMGSE